MKYRNYLFILVAMAPALLFGAGGGAPPAIETRPATDIYETEATLLGYLVSTSNLATQVFVYWGASDGVTNAGSWDHSYAFGLNTVGVTNYARHVATSLTAETTYFTRYSATNSEGETWSDHTESFITAQETPVGEQGLSGLATNVGNLALTNALVWYDFDNPTNATTVIDKSVNHNDGIALFPTLVRSNFTGGAYHISSADENAIAVLNNKLPMDTPSWTMAYWVNRSGYMDGNYVSQEQALDVSALPDNNPGYSFMHYPVNTAGGHTIFIYPETDNGICFIDYINTVANSVWHRVVIQYFKGNAVYANGATFRSWVDGKLKFTKTDATGAFLSGTGYWFIGKGKYVSSTWPDMLVDDFALDNTYWSDAQIVADYNAGRSSGGTYTASNNIPDGDLYIIGNPNLTTHETTNSMGNLECTNALVWYDFSDRSNPTSILDRTSNHNNGVALFTGSPVNNKSNGGYQITPFAQNAVAVSNNHLPFGTTFTIAMWVYRLNSPSFQMGNFVSQERDMTVAAPGMVLPSDLGTDIFFHWWPSDSVGGTEIQFSRTIDPANIHYTSPSQIWGAWHRLVIQYEKLGAEGTSTARFCMWQDMRPVGNISNAQNRFISNVGYWIFGKGHYVTTAWPNMAIDDVVIDNRYWTGAMVTNDYNAGRSTFSSVIDYPVSTVEGDPENTGMSILGVQ